MEKGLNPDVTIRPNGVIEKCTFCIHRIQKGKEQARVQGRELRDEDVIPACAETCPAKAIYFGDLHNPDSRVAKLSKIERAFTLQEDLGTEPKVYYLAEEERRV